MILGCLSLAERKTMPELSDSQREYWEQQLEFAERAVEVAKRMLGLLPELEPNDAREETAS